MSDLAKDGTSSETIVQPEVFNNEELAGDGDLKVSDYVYPDLPEGQDVAQQGPTEQVPTPAGEPGPNAENPSDIAPAPEAETPAEDATEPTEEAPTEEAAA